ncbi:MAG: HAD-IIIA family hydrolase [bacterium]|nr:HAD-IIIA family hydrolase [bacterium]
MTVKQSAIFLDRDGTINTMPAYADAAFDSPRVPADFVFIDGVVEALQQLDPRYALFVVTNQPGVAYGKIAHEGIVVATNDLMTRQLKQFGVIITDVATCLHSDNRARVVNHNYYHPACGCRKPAPGLVLQLAQKHNLDLSNSWVIGDRVKDVAAGQAAGINNLIIVNYEFSANEVCSFAKNVASMKEAVNLLR